MWNNGGKKLLSKLRRGEELCGRSTGKKKVGLESCWWNDETESAVKEKKERLNIWKRTGDENDKVEYTTAKGKAKRVVARVKAESIERLMINWKLLKDSKRSTELQLQGTNQARTYARYAMSKVPQERL